MSHIMIFVLVIGVIGGFIIKFIIYQYNRYLKYRYICTINNNLYYKRIMKDEREFCMKNYDGETFGICRSVMGTNLRPSHCLNCCFFSGKDRYDYTCTFIKAYFECPLKGKGYFVKIGEGL